MLLAYPQFENIPLITSHTKVSAWPLLKSAAAPFFSITL